MNHHISIDIYEVLQNNKKNFSSIEKEKNFSPKSVNFRAIQ
jgi:hypothetical protein